MNPSAVVKVFKHLVASQQFIAGKYGIALAPAVKVESAIILIIYEKLFVHDFVKAAQSIKTIVLL